MSAHGPWGPLPHDAHPDTHEGLHLRHLLAGVQASVVGVFLMFVWLMITSVWHGRSVWVVPNLFSTTFFGSNAYRNQWLSTSWAGIAMTVALYGVLGAVWGGFWKERSSRRLALYGAIFGLAVYFFLYDYVWSHLNPLVSLYAPSRQLEITHIVWGLILARSPFYARRIVAVAGLPPAVPPAPSINQEVSPAVSSGELIQ
jgi:hypothetical protein